MEVMTATAPAAMKALMLSAAGTGCEDSHSGSNGEGRGGEGSSRGRVEAAAVCALASDDSVTLSVKLKDRAATWAVLWGNGHAGDPVHGVEGGRFPSSDRIV